MARLTTCPQCKGTGRVPQKLPFGANPKVWTTRADKRRTATCPKCEGSGWIGIE